MLVELRKPSKYSFRGLSYCQQLPIPSVDSVDEVPLSSLESQDCSPEFLQDSLKVLLHGPWEDFGEADTDTNALNNNLANNQYRYPFVSMK